MNDCASYGRSNRPVHGSRGERGDCQCEDKRPITCGGTRLKMDYKGQKLAETLYIFLLIAAAVIAWIVGWTYGNFTYSFYGWGVALGISLLLCIPDWPMFNRHEVKWLNKVGELNDKSVKKDKNEKKIKDKKKSEGAADSKESKKEADALKKSEGAADSKQSKKEADALNLPVETVKKEYCTDSYDPDRYADALNLPVETVNE